MRVFRLGRGVRLHRNVLKMVFLAFIYGLVSINYIDFYPHHPVIGSWYHLWLAGQYFVPFVVIMLLFGLGEWEVVASLSLLVSLMNDLFYAPMGLLFGVWSGDLLDWYLWQLGFRGFDSRWWFQGGFFSFPVSSILMGVSIYVRVLLVIGLMWKWSREGER